MISGAYGGNPVIGIGSRPWLQKLAALTVAISLTIVTADTFKYAHRQYDIGYQDAAELTVKVANGMEVRVARIISETCLWLAQAQTLIRLFPRHKEKLLIKWIAFALIMLELIFTTLNLFVVDNPRDHSRRFDDAIPAMNYLFALALNLCYGAFVIYYALCKRRYAFYRPQMRNMPLVALLSLTAVLIPAVFFVLDLSKPNVSGWGSYVRWVGAAAASVVVWEWVERIEALERDEKKGGILGREIFDGDEMLDITPSSDASWPSSQSKKSKRPKGSQDSGSGGISTGWSSMTAKARRIVRPQLLRGPASQGNANAGNISSREQDSSIADREGHVASSQSDTYPSRPPPVASPVNRADTTSAASTVYVVRYHPNSDPTPPLQRAVELRHDDHHNHNLQVGQPSESAEHGAKIMKADSRGRMFIEGLQRLPNPFRRTRNTPPLEVVQALSRYPPEPGPSHTDDSYPTSFLERLHLKKTPKATEAPRPVIVVPATPHRVGSFDALVSSFDSGGAGEQATERSPSTSSRNSNRRDADQPPDAVVNAMNAS